MKIETKFFGNVDIDSNEVISFKKPILGFEGEDKFILIDIEELDSLKCLQSTKTKNLCFIVSTPWVYYNDYAFDIDDEISNHLEIKSEEEIEVFNILTLKDDFESSTINLSAPIILNNEKNFAAQIVIGDEKYSTSHPVKGS